MKVEVKWENGAVKVYHNVDLDSFALEGGKPSGGSDLIWAFSFIDDGGKEMYVRIPFRNVLWLVQGADDPENKENS